MSTATPSSAPPLPTNSLAVASLALGISSYVAIPVLGAVGAIICGHMARGQLKAKPGTERGDGMALAGLILGYAHFVLVCFAVALVMLVFGGIAAAAAHAH